MNRNIVIRAAYLSIALAFTSCGGEPEPSHPPPPSSTTTESDDHVDPTPPPASAAQPASAPPVVTFVATPGVGNVALSLANHGSQDVSLRSGVVVEVESGGGFGAAPTSASLTLRYDCQHEAEPCVTLAPGAELLPPDWLGTWGDAQCACEHCVPVTPGRYRLVVTTCDGAHRVESNAFAMPAQ